jgi:hypothetical protein
MKTPQEIKNEVEKKDYKEVDKWIEECDVDGRMIEFEFFDSDIEDLKNCVKREKLSILTEYDKSIKEMIEELKEDISHILEVTSTEVYQEFANNEGVAKYIIKLKKDLHQNNNSKINEFLSKIGEKKQDE